MNGWAWRGSTTTKKTLDARLLVDIVSVWGMTGPLQRRQYGSDTPCKAWIFCPALCIVFRVDSLRQKKEAAMICCEPLKMIDLPLNGHQVRCECCRFEGFFVCPDEETKDFLIMFQEEHNADFAPNDFGGHL